MIEVVGTNDRVWLTVAQVRVGLTPDAAAQLSVALRDAATAIMGSGEIVEGEILGAPV